jgi:hypothetical protein
MRSLRSRGTKMESLLYTIAENWNLFVAVVAAYYVLSVLRIDKIVG